MKMGTPLLISLVAIAAMLAVSLWGWTVIPDGTRVAMHWNANGVPNRFVLKEHALFVLPALAVALTVMFALIPSIEPRRANLLASRKLYLTGWYGSLFVLANVHLFIVLVAAGWHVDIRRWTFAVMGLLFIALGNFLGKSRSTFFVGLRLPWTLSSELAWSKSNRLAGLGLVATGLATLIAVFLTTSITTALVFGIGTFLSVTVAGIASYFYWKHDPNKIDGGSIHE